MNTRFYVATICALSLFFVLALSHLGPPLAQAGSIERGLSPGAEAPGSTIVASNITTHTTWTKAGSPYSVTVNVNVVAGVTLTIEPGVEVLFTGQFIGMGVAGTVVAIGSPSEPITFTGTTKQPGSWRGVDINPGGNGSFRHVVMEYGRDVSLPNNGILTVIRGTASVSQSVFRFGISNGIASDIATTRTVQISATTFISNGRSAARFYGSGLPSPQDPVLRNLTASGNGRNAVEYVGANLAGAHVWEVAGLPYVVPGGLTVRSDGSLTVAPGVEVQVENAISVIGGTLTALGTPAEPITFTGITKTLGAWWGITVASAFPLSGTASFRHVTLEYGGRTTSSEYANLTVGYGTTVSITQSVIRNGGRNGITVGRGAVEVSNTSLTGNAGYAIFLSDSTDADQVLRNITASGNLTDAIGIRQAYILDSGQHLWENVGLPYITEGDVTISAPAALTVEPGVVVRVGKNASINVFGRLEAVGAPTLPITVTGAFTSSISTPGWWKGFDIRELGRAAFQHCDIGYGGAVPSQAMLMFSTSQAIVQDCRIHDSLSAGIETHGIATRPFVRENRIEQNDFGLRNNGVVTVDARLNWWGDVNGPFHATNPGGQGNAVSNRVLFRPWRLVSGEVGGEQLLVQLNGPARFTPGSVHEYAISYDNATAQTVQNAVLMVALPSFAEYVDDSGGGILWPQRRQLFWKLGNLEPGALGLVSFRVRFYWGIPIGVRDTAVAQLAGTNLGESGFNVQSYLDYVPITVVAEQPLSLSQVQAERQSYAQFDQLYTQAIQEGYTRTIANRFTLSAGEPVTEVVLLRFQPQPGATFLRRQGSRIQATIVDTSSYLVRTTGGTLSFNFQTDDWEIVGGSAAFSGEGPQAVSISFEQCMKNCIMKLIPKTVVKTVFKSTGIIFKAIDCVKAATTRDELDMAKCAQIIKKVPGVGEGIDLGRCNSDCQQDPNSHVCTQDIRYCDDDNFPYGTFGIHVIKQCRCITDPATGRAGQYMACETIQVCAICEKCVDGGAGPVCTVPSPTPGGFASAAPAQHTAVSSSSDKECSECVVAKDPNAKFAPAGDVLAGQLMTYTITYENEGAGTAYDVFVVDKMPEELDTSTLTVLGGGEYLSGSRTLIWWVGQLAPKGQPGSTGVVSFTVRLKPNLATGTAVVNQAVVHFPSVPEETPTNPVVNIVQPLAAVPQSLETVAGQPIAIKLQGRDPSGAALTYAVVEPPLHGELSGTAPNLIYTPAANFTGLDHFGFTVANAITTSRPADVDILVRPSPADTTPPQVIWTEPSNGEVIAQIVATPHFTDTLGPLYLPPIRIAFSEAISDTTVTTNTIQVRDGGGRLIPIRVAYDGLLNEVIVLFREALKPGTQYTFTVTTGIRDLKGNALPANYTWSIRTAGNTNHTIYLPLISRTAVAQ